MTPTEIKAKITDLVISYTGGVIEGEFKTVLNDIVDSLGTGGGASLLVIEEPKTASFNVVDVDAFKLYVVNSASAVTITIPSGLTAGNWWEVLNIGTGQVSFAASGSTIISPDNRLKIRARYSTARIIARASNQISLGGDLVL